MAEENLNVEQINDEAQRREKNEGKIDVFIRGNSKLVASLWMD